MTRRLQTEMMQKVMEINFNLRDAAQEDCDTNLYQTLLIWQFQCHGTGLHHTLHDEDKYVHKSQRNEEDLFR